MRTVFDSMPKNYPAETIGRLNQKFFGRRVETIFISLMPQSRVFSKNFLRQLPDGTTQASGWRAKVSKPTGQYVRGKQDAIL
jgi:hypothetical protein